MKIKANFTTKCILRLFGWRVYISKTRMVQEIKSAMKPARAPKAATTAVTAVRTHRQSMGLRRRGFSIR